MRTEETLRSMDDMAVQSARGVSAELVKLKELVDHCEKGMVALLDARGALEDRLQPVLSSIPAGDERLMAAWPSGSEPSCELAMRVASQCHRLQQLVDSMSAEEQQLRSIASRVEV